MHHGGPSGRCLRSLLIGVLLSLLAASAAVAGEWETVRGNYENALKATRSGSTRSKRRRGADPQAAGRPSRDQSEYLDIVTSEWGAGGRRRAKKARGRPWRTSQKNLERANASLAGGRVATSRAGVDALESRPGSRRR